MKLALTQIETESLHAAGTISSESKNVIRLPVAKAMATSHGSLIGGWFARYKSRQALRALDDHLLDDIGLSREQAEQEAAKPFWKA